MPMGDCQVWAFVDFGRGRVAIRCTETGEHTEHKCEIFISEPEVEHQTRNIFTGE